jgi:hypothetical protein
MPASLRLSIASGAVDLATQEQHLLRTAAACPADIVFYDVLRDGDVTTPVRVTGGPSPTIERIPAAEAPPHAAESIGSVARDLMWHFEHIGDVLIPGLDADAHAGDLDLGDGVSRVLGSLEELAEALEDDFADQEFVDEAEPETLEFLQMLREKVAVCRRERLPLVASW